MTNFMNNQCLSSLIQGPTSEAVVQICSVKKVFLEISQNSQENTCIRVSYLIKLQAGATLTIFEIIFNFKQSLKLAWRPARKYWSSSSILVRTEGVELWNSCIKQQLYLAHKGIFWTFLVRSSCDPYSCVRLGWFGVPGTSSSKIIHQGPILSLSSPNFIWN